jgi:hypothetical protein
VVDVVDDDEAGVELPDVHRDGVGEPVEVFAL